jgi:hypothetical protein
MDREDVTRVGLRRERGREGGREGGKEVKKNRGIRRVERGSYLRCR